MASVFDRLNPFSGDFLNVGIPVWDDNLNFFNQFSNDLNAEKGLNALGLSNTQAVQEGQDSYDKLLEMAQGTGAENEGDLARYYKQMQNKYGNDQYRLQNAIDRYLGADTAQVGDFDYTGNVEDFSYDKGVQDFLDPAMKMRQMAAMDAINNEAASAGNKFSSDYISRLGSKMQALASDEWEKAYNRLMQDRQQANSEFQGDFANENTARTMALNEWLQNASNQRQNQSDIDEKMKYAIEAYSAGNDKADEALQDYISGLINSRNTNLQTAADVTSGKANLGMQSQSGIPGAISSIFKAISM